MQHLAITPTAVNSNGLGTLNFYRTAQAGNFKLWGATGSDGDSHLEHLRYIGEFLDDMSLATVQAPEPSSVIAISFVAATTILRRRRRITG